MFTLPRLVLLLMMTKALLVFELCSNPSQQKLATLLNLVNLTSEVVLLSSRRDRNDKGEQ